MTDKSETPEERRLRAKKRKLDRISGGNEKMYGELRALVPGLEINGGELRREILIEFLEDQGIISPEQRIDFELTFQDKVEQVLSQWLVDVKEKMAAQKAMEGFVVAQKPQVILGPDGQPLVAGG